MAICKLCLKDRKLIGKSHIIPDFMYNGLFDDKHKMFYFKPFKVANKKDFVKRPSSGEYEGGILCEKCDNGLIGSFETYARDILYSTQLKPEQRLLLEKQKTKEGIVINHFKNIDYQKFKIFLLSILWRASISSRPFFNQVSLGANEQLIRKMIYEGNPGNINDYPIFITTYLNDKTQASDLISQPRKVQNDKQTTYISSIGGLLYDFYIETKKSNIPKYVISSTIRPTNELDIVELPLDLSNGRIRGLDF